MRRPSFAGGASWIDIAFWEFLVNLQVHRLSDDALGFAFQGLLHARLFLQAAQCLGLYTAETDHFVVGLRYPGVGGVRFSHQNCIGAYGHMTTKYTLIVNDATLIPSVLVGGSVN